MPKKLRWGVLSTANIGLKKVLPAMQLGRYTSVDAIASRDLNKARDAAAELGILKAYGSYEELLADPEIDAIYNPLPNHLHVPWTIKAALAGKHVLCEKPAREREEIAQVSRILRRIKALKVVAVLSHQSAALDTQLHGVGRQQPGDISFGEEGVRSLQRKLLGALDVHLDERRRGCPAATNSSRDMVGTTYDFSVPTRQPSKLTSPVRSAIAVCTTVTLPMLFSSRCRRRKYTLRAAGSNAKTCPDSPTRRERASV